MVRAVAALAVAAAVLLVVFPGGDDRGRAQQCLGLEPFMFDTYEVYDNAGLYLAAIELAAAGEAVPSSTTPSGEPHGLDYPGLLKGSRDERLDQEPDTTLRIPPTLLKSIVWVESEFGHADDAIPWGGVGPVKRSYDCGFGLGQITTGMENRSGSPSAGQALVGTHFLFNLAEAARMLAQKWNGDFLPIAGEGDPASLEDWYYAVWAYNGLAYVNHPLYNTGYESTWLEWLDHTQNPFLDPLRGDVWHCNDSNAPTWFNSGDGVTPLYGYGDYTYPERVYGCMRHPPEYPRNLYNDPEYAPTPWPEPAITPEEDTSDTEDSEEPDEAEDASDEGDTSEDDTSEDDTSEGDTSEDGDQTSEGDGVSENEDTSEDGEETAAETWPEPGADGIPRMWPPVRVNMPDPAIPAVVAALSPQNYIACANAFWWNGCPAMHFPTSFPNLGIEAHRDPTPPVDPALRERLLGAPSMLITGPDEVSIAIDEDGSPGSVEVLIQNMGTWIAPYRVQTSDLWILVEPGDRYGRIHGGVAVGADTTVVICRAIYCGEDISKRGHIPVLTITIDPEELPEGEESRGVVVIEPLFGEGEARSIVVHAGSSVETTASRWAQEDADEEEDEQALKYRAVVPGLAKDD